MKDVISILQSRVAKRENVIALFEQARNYNNFFRHLIEQQKQDKRILAEIVRLRRKTKRLNAEEQFDIVFDKRFEELVAGVIRSKFVEVTEEGEKPIDEEMVCALLKVRWGV